MRKQIIIAAALVITIGAAPFTGGIGRADAQEDNIVQDYADVNGLHMYYEIHGEGEPLVVLHGAYMSIDMMGELVTRLAETRRVIAVELQAHGRTNDLPDRPITYEGMADDVAALMDAIGIDKADVFGYSMGGAAALQVAIRHPERVDKLVVASAAYRTDGAYAEVWEGIAEITPEVMAGTPYGAEYMRLAPNPENWPSLVEKLLQLDTTVMEWTPESIQAISAPTFVIIGDGDIVRPEHAVDMFRLRGGGVPADLTGLPNARLAVLPGTTHVTVINRADWLVPMIVEFLDAPVTESAPAS